MSWAAQVYVLFALFLSAASSLLYEVATTEVFFYHFVESSYSFASVISVFLFGLGSGALLTYWVLPRIKRPATVFVLLQLIIGMYAAVALLGAERALAGLSTSTLLIAAFGLLFAPALLLGAALPLAAALLPEQGRNRAVGLIYAIDMTGAIAGAVLSGFFLLPEFGVRATIIVGAFLNAGSAAFMYAASATRWVRPLLFTALLACAGAALVYTIDVQAPSDPGVTFDKESPFGLVTIRDGSLLIDMWEQCSIHYPPDATERGLADHAISALGTRDSEVRLLNIGLGCGLTAEQVLRYPRTFLDIVEINPVVIEANRLLSDVQEHERARLITDDGLRYMRNATTTYDAIMVDIEDPRIAHSSKLYTVEAFAVAEQLLREDGVFALWTFAKPDGDPRLVSRYEDILYYSLKESFSHVYEYPGVFIATDRVVAGAHNYTPTGGSELNTIDHNVLATVFQDMIWSHRSQ